MSNIELTLEQDLRLIWTIGGDQAYQRNRMRTEIQVSEWIREMVWQTSKHRKFKLSQQS
jgi:hypothetical protein